MDEEPKPIEVEPEEGDHVDGPSHHPIAPSDELFDISTTVDPSYIISLIRKLLPENVTGQQFSGNQGSNIENSGEDRASSSENEAMQSHGNVSESMDCTEDFRECCNAGDEQGLGHGVSVGEEAWEEYGCVLWDLAASKTHAELMVENFLLEVLAANLTVQRSVRAIEISLGIIGNLACHEAPMKRILCTNGLIELIINQLFLDDTQCLCEACRLLSLSLRSSESCTWATALQSENILSRVLWIVENSLNLQLIEKSVELLLAMIEGSKDIVHVVLPSLMKMGLPNILISLLAFEIDILMTERVPERVPILDVILRAIEAVSVIDGHSQEISSSKKLFLMVCELVKLPDKAEVANSCVTAAVLIANILSDEADFASEISSDMTFLQGLLDTFPLASDDLEARSALWNIMANLLIHIHESKPNRTMLNQYASILTAKSDIIEDDLLDDQFDSLKSKARKTAVTKIISILNQWTDSGEDEEKIGIGVGRLLDFCRRHCEERN